MSTRRLAGPDDELPPLPDGITELRVLDPDGREIGVIPAEVYEDLRPEVNALRRLAREGLAAALREQLATEDRATVLPEALGGPSRR